MIKIRKCNIDDVDRLEEANRSDRFTQYGFKGFINQPKCEERCFAAFDDGKVVGFMLTDIADNKERIYTSLVRPDYRRQRVMTHLFKKVLNDMAKCNKDSLFLNVRSHKRNNIDAYKMGGFKETQRIPGYYGNGDTAIRMEYDLEKYRKHLEKRNK